MRLEHERMTPAMAAGRNAPCYNARLMLVADGQAWSRVGIMEVDGDEIHLCVNFPQGPRPTRFGKSDDGSESVLLRRVKSAGG